MDSFLIELGKSGPWATVAGFLLWQVIKAWNSDRMQVTTLLGEFRETLRDLTKAIQDMGHTLEEMKRK